MDLLRKRNGLNESIPFMAIMASINVIFSLLITIFPVGAFFLILLLPLTSSFVSYSCKEEHYFIYFVASIVVSSIATIWDISFTLFYLIPSLFTGFFFGYSFKTKMPLIINFAISVLTQTLLTYLAYKIIKGEHLILESFEFLGISKLTDFIGTFLTIISLIQIALSFLILFFEFKKYSKENPKQLDPKLSLIFVFCLSVISFSLTFFKLDYSTVFLIFNLVFSIDFIARQILENTKTNLIILIASSITFIFIFALINPIISNNLSIGLFNIFPLLIVGAITFFRVLKKSKSS